MQPYRRSLKKDPAGLITALEAKGYRAGELEDNQAGPGSFNKLSLDQAARYIVGQGLKWLKQDGWYHNGMAERYARFYEKHPENKA